MEDLEIPAGIQGNAVICKDQLALLQFVQSAQHDDGHFGEAKLARGGKPAMACNDVTFGSNQNGVRKPKCSDASGDSRDLSVGVRTRVASRRDQSLDRPSLQTQSLRRQICWIHAVHVRLRFAPLTTPPPTDKKVSEIQGGPTP